MNFDKYIKRILESAYSEIEEEAEDLAGQVETPPPGVKLVNAPKDKKEFIDLVFGGEYPVGI